jgi:cytochrome o ubiquinol oxidase subunit 1
MLWFLGFVITFTLGGVSGVLMAVPAIDFQVHNSLFLVAHFHNVIIGGVVFGFFAGLTYWFPKIFGFTLNERLGKYAVYCWIVGFMVAFLPLYVLGLMGVTRRLDHYDNSGWQILFIVAGLGVMIIALGVALQLLQLVVSIWQRKKNRIGNDPWNGRTLEWSVPSPAPFYNYAITPQVHDRDQFWESKRALAEGKKPEKRQYEDITLPKNSGLGFIIGMLAFIFSFGIVWHIWWLAIVGIVGVIICVIARSSDDEVDYILSASELKRLDTMNQREAVV